MKKFFVLALVGAFGIASAVEYGPGAGFSVPDSSAVGAGSNYTVTGALPTVGSLNWVKVNFGTSTAAPNKSHTWAGDIIAVFSHVGSGTSMHLMSRVGSTTAAGVGDSSDLSGTYRFFEVGADFAAAAATATAAQAIANGDYARSTHFLGAGAGNSGNGTPQYNGGLFANFAGLALNGDWRLFLTDNAGGDVGDVTSWSFDVTPTPEPGTMAVLGLGALALMRRRAK